MNKELVWYTALVSLSVVVLLILANTVSTWFAPIQYNLETSEVEVEVHKVQAGTVHTVELNLTYDGETKTVPMITGEDYILLKDEEGYIWAMISVPYKSDKIRVDYIGDKTDFYSQKFTLKEKESLKAQVECGWKYPLFKGYICNNAIYSSMRWR